MSAWSQGADTIRQLIREGALDQVVPSLELANRLVSEGQANLISAETTRSIDPGGAIQLAYDAARKAATGLLAAQGLRPTTSGGHVAVQRAMLAQFGRQFRHFARMRRRRHEQEYPGPDSPTATEGDAIETIDFARMAIEEARQVLASGRLGAWS